MAKKSDSAKKGAQATIEPIVDIDREKQTFDGKKVDLYINTGKMGGKHFLVTVNQGSAKPVLIAVHL